ncbi:SAVMC3_10250 family protein [Streptomyces nigrescens]
MRELVYVSDVKLQRFVENKQRVWPKVTLNLSTPVGGLTLQPGADDESASRMRKLAQVSKRLERSARWFGDTEVQPGEWVAFEALLARVWFHGVMERLLLFVDPPGEEPRLLLHGSAHHLVGMHRTPGDYEHLAPMGSDIEGYKRLIGLAGDTLLLRMMDYLHPETPWCSLSEPDWHPVRPRVSMIQGTSELLNTMDREEMADTALPMRGLAYVTAVGRTEGGQRFVVASPLYVEKAPADGT